MADEFIYQQKEGITPGGNLAGVGAALGNHPAPVPDTQKSLADMQYFTQYAQKSFSELNTELGRMRGQRPGGFLVPPIFESQKDFHEAYKHEELQNIAFEGQQSLKKMYQLAARNPTTASLQNYQAEGSKTVDELVGIATPSNQPGLKRALEGQYENGALNLAEAVFERDRQQTKMNVDLRFSEGVKQISEDAENGNKQLSNEQKVKLILDNDTAYINGIYDKQEHLKRAQLIEDAETIGELNGVITKATIDGDAAEKIEHFAKNKPEGMSNEKHREMLSQMMKTSNMVQSALSGQQNLEYQDTVNKLRADVRLSPAEILDAKKRMGTANALRLDYEMLKFNGVSTQLQNGGRQVAENASNAVFLANSLPSHVNYAVDKIFIPAAENAKGQPLTLLEQGQLLSNFPAPVESFQKRLSAGLNVGTPEQKLDAASTISHMQDTNPAVLKGMAKNDLRLADMYKHYINDPQYQGIDGADKIKQKIDPVDDVTRQERDRMVRTYVEAKQLNNYNFLQEDTIRALDLKPKDKPKLPSGLTQVYYNNVTSAIRELGNIELAEQQAKRELKEYYGQNDKKEVKFMPPEKAYTNLGYLLQNDKVRAVDEMIKHNNLVKEKGGFVMNDLAWDKVRKFGDPYNAPIHEGDIKIKVDGKLREVCFESDITTQISPSNEISWALGFYDENRLFRPLMNPYENMSTYRFIPNQDFYMDAMSKPEVEAKVIEHANKKEIDETRKYENEQLKKALEARDKSNQNDKFWTMFNEDLENIK